MRGNGRVSRTHSDEEAGADDHELSDSLVDFRILDGASDGVNKEPSTCERIIDQYGEGTSSRQGNEEKRLTLPKSSVNQRSSSSESLQEPDSREGTDPADGSEDNLGDVRV